mgnify:CR=1 FL=1
MWKWDPNGRQLLKKPKGDVFWKIEKGFSHIIPTTGYTISHMCRDKDGDVICKICQGKCSCKIVKRDGYYFYLPKNSKCWRVH